MPQRTRAALGLAVLLILPACGNDPLSVGPVERTEAVGSYDAVLLTTTEGSVTTDALADGFDVSIQLNADGTTAGTLVIPGDDDADLTGTWSFQEGDEPQNEPPTVTFDHTADTFLRDMVFEALRGEGTIQLHATDSFQGLVVELVLARI